MKLQKIAIVDYGVGNLYSVQRALEHSGATEVCITSSPNEILDSDKLILPGVGAFCDGMNGLESRNLTDPIIEFANSGKPLLGICLGMQLLATSSEEFGSHNGLGLIPGKVVPIPSESDDGNLRKIPHIGWASLEPPHRDAWLHPIIDSLSREDSVYLVHSFHMQPTDHANLLATYEYRGYQITAAVISNNIFGYQFHPEKSGPVGLRLIKNFLNY
ncbi:imidazole glycerol phosphate synthase subunit HisH [Limnobacter sp.]|uniref:imidazole glycerol phosphate synthase subunit HisH n=1 Tax=Limnobacter sp. TaxID=2003368 RepID=UPI00311E4C82